MPRSLTLRIASIACASIVATVVVTLELRRSDHIDQNAIAAIEHAERQQALADSLIRISSGAGTDSLILQEAGSGPVHLSGPTLVVWDDPGQGVPQRPTILLQPHVVDALREVAEEEGFTLAVRTTRDLRIDNGVWYFGTNRAPGSRSESFVLVAPGSQSEQFSGLMSPEEVRAWLRHYRNTYRT